ncbi:type II secretion system protein GspC [Escherichia sp. TW14182]|uniref:type II secretion system protein GspC n=1 Tax=Escherichia sp. TW14182 TaxID=754336 RepID=UPI001ED94CFB
MNRNFFLNIVRYMLWILLFSLYLKMSLSLWRYITLPTEYTKVSNSVTEKKRMDSVMVNTESLKLIQQQNWFGKYQPTTAFVHQPQSASVTKTSLNVKLRGIALGARPGAVIEDGAKQQVLLLGESLTNNKAVITGIYPDHVMISHQGKIECLRLVDESYSTDQSKTENDDVHKVQTLPVTESTFPRKTNVLPMTVREMLAKDPQEVFNFIQFTPVRKAGVVGYTVKPGVDRALFDASGFKEGDIAVALNQQDLKTPDALNKLRQQVYSMTSMQITILRNGAYENISISLH